MRGVTAAFFATAIVAVTSTAQADKPPPPTAEDFGGTPAAPPPGAASSPPASAASAAPAPMPVPAPPVIVPAPREGGAPASGGIRLRMKAYRPKDTARLYRQVGPEQFAFVCNSPCRAELPEGTNLRAVLNDGDEPHDFTLNGRNGEELDLEVRPASRGALAGGIVLTSLGGVTFLVGIILTALGASHATDRTDDLLLPGLITLGAGGGLTIGGLVMLSNVSKEPRVRQEPRDRFEHDEERRSDREISASLPRVPGARVPVLGFAF